jgi:hypothetical protein
MPRKLALLLTHGMGEQQAYELTDSFVRNLTDALGEEHRVTLQHRIVTDDETSPPTSHVRMSLANGKSPTDVKHIDVHEVFWADKPQGIIKLKEVGKWLFRTSLAPLLRWSQNASLFYQPDKERRWWQSGFVFLKELLTAASLPLLGALLLLFTLNGVTLLASYIDNVKEGLQDARPSGWQYVWLGLFLIAVMGAVSLLSGMVRLIKQVAYERRLTSTVSGDGDNNQYAARWAWLQGWAWGSLVASIVLGVVAWLTYENAQIPRLLEIVLRLERGESFLKILLAALVLGLTVGLAVLLYDLLWAMRWSGIRRWVRVLGAFAVTIGVALMLRWFFTEFEQPARIVFWVAGLAVVWIASRFLVSSIGDVAIYLDGIKETSPHHKVREDILKTTTRRLVDLLKSPEYDEVFVASHSLGSVISYDAINRVATARRSVMEQLGTAVVDEGEFAKLKGFYSFGSPLDKVVYLFFKTAKMGAPVREQILSSLVSFFRTSSGRPYGRYKFEPYEPQVPQGFRWHNAWSWGDVLGHRIDFYSADPQPHFDYAPVVAHVRFWTDPLFYRSVLEWMDAWPNPPDPE